jgi:predicted MFS family arabinose efflux permease
MFELRWRMLAILFLARTALGFQFQTVASTAPFLRDQFAVGFTEIGTLIGLYMVPGVVLALPGGFLVRRFGDKTLCCVGLGLMGFGGVLIGLSDTYSLVLAGRLISGTGGVFLGLAVTKMTTDWFAGREIVTAMSILLTSWPLGIAAGLLAYAPLAQAQGWPWAMYLAAGTCLVGLVLVAALYRSPVTVPVSGAPPSVRSAFSFPPRHEVQPILVAGLIWGVFNLGLIAFFSFVPPLLAEHGYGFAEGAFITSLVLWLMMISVPAGGHWLQRTGRTDATIMLFSALTGLAMAALPLAPSVALLFACAVGFLIGPPPGAIMAMPGRVLRPETRAVGLGLFMTIYNVTVAGGPVLAGALKDEWGASAPILFGAALFVGVVPLTMLFRSLIVPASQIEARRSA